MVVGIGCKQLRPNMEQFDYNLQHWGHQQEEFLIGSEPWARFLLFVGEYKSGYYHRIGFHWELKHI